MAVWGDISIVSFEPSNHIVSTVSSAQSVVSVRFTQPYCTVGEVRWELRDGVDYSIIIHSETYVLPSSSVTKSGDVYTLEFDLAQYVTANTDYNLYLYAYPVGEDSVPCLSYVTAYAPPTVSIVSPADGASIATLPLGITWSVTDSTGIAAQDLYVTTGTVYDPLGIVWGSYQDPRFDQDTRAVSLDGASVPFENGEDYCIFLRVTNGVGFKTDVEVTFSTSWVAPATPTATVTTDPDALSVSIAVVEGDGGGGEPATDALMVVRVSADGTRWVVASDMDSGDTCVDPLPPLGVEYAYEVTASSAVGATAVATYNETVETTRWAFNCGIGATLVQSLYGNPKASWSLKHGGELYYFADGGQGNGLPVYYPTTDRDMSGTLTFDTIGQADSDLLRERSFTYPVMWMRDPFGHRWRAHVNVGGSHGVGEVWPLTLSWDAVRFEEAW